MSKIEWTGETWNPMVGCGRVSAGCDHCYAEGQVHRFGKSYDRETTIKLGSAVREGLTFLPVDGNGRSLGKGARWTGAVWLLPDVLDVPLRRKKPTVYFVNSLSDVFHEAVTRTEEGRRFVAAMFGVMAACPQHTFQILTKRPKRAAWWFRWAAIQREGAEFLCRNAALDALGWSALIYSAPKWPLPNVWIGASIEDQATADERIPDLLRVPAAVRFLSAEPLLGSVNLDEWIAASTANSPGIDWIICGGESGPKARPMRPDWARSLRDQCQAAGVPFFFKQWGEWGWPDQLPDETVRDIDAGDHPEALDGYQPLRVGKKAAGRELDERVWDEMPRGGE